ncbi:MAG: glycosyltransferase [Planctomycetaceae bacterium]|nr:glycosyltransferase [Planctomycetales bacterium]MCB9874934.1 glycosyltransferase [Planctomycetaceae bacterium]MCB9923790.1 glycosyltransferase [Planctomycetaceae bacterium]
MKLLQIYNQYRSLFNGEEAVVELTAELVERHGGTARLMMRSSRDIGMSLASRTRAFWSGIYSREAYQSIEQVLVEDRPDVVHVHNLYPLFSPSVLVACKRAAIPVVMSVHNQQLTCPRADHLYRGTICEKCVGGNEYHCVLRNCRQNIFESIAYATRTAFARRMRLFHDNVTLFVAVSEFAKSRLVAAGFDERQIVVLRNMVAASAGPADASLGTYAAFAGRLSPEKGLHTLVAAAEAFPDCPVLVAGSGPLLEQLKRMSPQNMDLKGQLIASQINQLYRGARFVVVPSITYEMCPLVILEAFSHGIPVIASRLGAQRELVADNVNGLLFEPGNPKDLERQMRHLWNNPELCRRLGQAGYECVVRDHSEDRYYERLIGVYRRAISMTEQKTQATTAKSTSNSATDPIACEGH